MRFTNSAVYGMMMEKDSIEPQYIYSGLFKNKDVTCVV